MLSGGTSYSDRVADAVKKTSYKPKKPIEWSSLSKKVQDVLKDAGYDRSKFMELGKSTEGQKLQKQLKKGDLRRISEIAKEISGRDKTAENLRKALERVESGKLDKMPERVTNAPCDFNELAVPDGLPDSLKYDKDGKLRFKEGIDVGTVTDPNTGKPRSVYCVPAAKVREHAGKDLPRILEFNRRKDLKEYEMKALVNQLVNSVQEAFQTIRDLDADGSLKIEDLDPTFADALRKAVAYLRGLNSNAALMQQIKEALPNYYKKKIINALQDMDDLRADFEARARRDVPKDGSSVLLKTQMKIQEEVANNMNLLANNILKLFEASVIKTFKNDTEDACLPPSRMSTETFSKYLAGKRNDDAEFIEQILQNDAAKISFPKITSIDDVVKFNVIDTASEVTGEGVYDKRTVPTMMHSVTACVPYFITMLPAGSPLVKVWLEMIVDAKRLAATSIEESAKDLDKVFRTIFYDKYGKSPSLSPSLRGGASSDDDSGDSDDSDGSDGSEIEGGASAASLWSEF